MLMTSFTLLLSRETKSSGAKTGVFFYSVFICELSFFFCFFKFIKIKISENRGEKRTLNKIIKSNTKV